MKKTKKTKKTTGAIYIGAVDLGGSYVKSGVLVVNPDGSKKYVPAEEQTPSMAQSEDPHKTLAQMYLALSRACHDADVDLRDLTCVGLDTPGPASVDGILQRSGNFPGAAWDLFPVREAFQKIVGKKVFYSNDGDAAAYGEFLYGIPEHGEDITLVGLFPGTGLGGGVVWRGNLITSRYGAASELGHIKIPTQLVGPWESVSCTCGGKFCAEAKCSIMGLKGALESSLKDPMWKTHPLQKGYQSMLDKARTLLKLADKNQDELAMSIFMGQACALGLLCSQLCVTYGPDIFVIGGGMADAGEQFKRLYMNEVETAFKQVTMEAYRRAFKNGKIKFVWAAQGDNAAAAGAAYQAYKEWQKA